MVYDMVLVIYLMMKVMMMIGGERMIIYNDATVLRLHHIIQLGMDQHKLNK